jgi:hypothetical protein
VSVSSEGDANDIVLELAPVLMDLRQKIIDALATDEKHQQ